jgi:hypothetical protein
MPLKDEPFYKKEIQDIVNGLQNEDETVAKKALGKISSSKDLLHNHDIMEAALTSPHDTVKHSYAGNPILSDPDILNLMADHPDSEVQAGAARNVHTSENTLNYLADKEDDLVGMNLAQRHSLSDDLKNKLANSESFWIANHMARRDDLSPEQYEKFATHPSDRVQANAIGKVDPSKHLSLWPKLSDSSKTEILKGESLHPEIRKFAPGLKPELATHFAGRRDLTEDEANEMFNSPHYEVKSKILERHGDKLSQDKVDKITENLKNNPEGQDEQTQAWNLLKNRGDKNLITTALKHGRGDVFQRAYNNMLPRDKEQALAAVRNENTFYAARALELEDLHPDAVKAALDSNSDVMKQKALVHPNVSDQDLMDHLSHEDDGLAYAAAKNEKLLEKPSLQEHLMEHGNTSAASDFLKRTSGSRIKGQTLAKAMQSDNADIRKEAVFKMDKNVHSHLLDDALGDSEGLVRMAAATRELPEDVIDKHLTSQYQNVIDGLATNDELTEKQAMYLKNRVQNEDAKRKLQGTLKRHGHWDIENPVDVKFDSNRARIVRDLARDNGGKIHKRDVEKAGIHPDTVGAKWDSQGNFHEKTVKDHIDNLPKKTYSTNSTQWHGGQRHSDQSSDVFQMALTPDHAQQLKNEGLFPLFKKIHEESFQRSHPGLQHNGIGWVRHTSDDHGTFIDEIQSDLGQTLQRKMADLKPTTKDNPVYDVSELKGMDPKEKTAMDREKLSKLKRIHEIVFNGKHPSEVLHEGFLQHLRDNHPDKMEKGVHLWKPESKATISLGDKEKDPPVHMQEGYGKIPKKMGYSNAAYGDLTHQENPKHQGKPTQYLILRKKETLYK